MKVEPDDPILTAYALCELDEVCFAAVEEALKDSPKAQQEVEDILYAGNWLSQELTAEPSPVLEEHQRAAIAMAAAKTPDNVVRISWKRVSTLGGLAAVACLGFAILVAGLWTKPRETGSTAERASSIQATSPPAPASAGAPSSDPPLLAQSETPVTPPFAEQPGDQSTETGVESYRLDPRLLERYGLRPREVGPPSKNGRSSVSPEPPQARARSSEFPAQNYAWHRYGARYSPLIDLPERSGESANLEPGTATYPSYSENTFRTVMERPLSTFSIDVDTASYANVRRFLNQGQLPPREAVRIEEMINYFSYQYPQPRGDDPFSASIEAATCPWNPEHRLVRIGLQARTLTPARRPPSNLVFLIDVSGSMQPPQRLPLIKQALRALTRRMGEGDRIAIVAYAGHSRLVLPSTSCDQKEKVLSAIDTLQASGTTNGGEGIQEAYRVAEQNFLPHGVNRVILCTDGDFNVGITSQPQLIRLIQQMAKSGVFLTTLGVGTDNYNDALMQRLADKGNGNYHYLDGFEEAQKVLIEQMNANLVTIAKDVKIQVEFNPAQVSSYRLVGYEKRLLRSRDFNDDSKDAGEAGAGHAITALYEVIPAKSQRFADSSTLRYQRLPPRPNAHTGASKELLTLQLRYKHPHRDVSEVRDWSFTDNGQSWPEASTDFRFAAAVANFAMLLQGSEMAGASNFEGVMALAEQAKGLDENGSRAEFINLVTRAKQWSKRGRHQDGPPRAGTEVP